MNWEDHVSDSLMHYINSKPARRRCLKCRHVFNSVGAQNRLCHKCQHEMAEVRTSGVTPAAGRTGKVGRELVDD